MGPSSLMFQIMALETPPIQTSPPLRVIRLTVGGMSPMTLNVTVQVMIEALGSLVQRFIVVG